MAKELVKDCNISYWSRLFSGRDDRRKAVIIIRDWVAKNIRDAGPGLNELPLSAISPADVTLKDRYGNSADRAVLLTVMLRSIGFEADPVPVSGYSPLPEVWGNIYNFPQPVFNSVLCAVELHGLNIYLNDTSQYAELGTVAHDNNMGLDLKKGQITTIKSTVPDDFTIKYDVSLDAKGTALITRQLISYGSFYEGKKRLYEEITPENRRRRHQTLVASIAQSARPVSPLAADFKSYPGSEQFKVQVPGFAVSEGNYYYFKLPGMEMLKGFVSANGETRENPYQVSSDLRFSMEYSLKLPAGYDIGSIESMTQAFKTPGSAVSIRAVPGENGTFKLHVHCTHNPAWIEKYRYPQLVAMNAGLNNPKLSLVILKKKAAGK
jgi:hypothetical protein